jgi:hypothetical protein
MRDTRRDHRKTAVLALGLGLALGAGSAVQAQDMTGPPGLSSGTGAGTGAGGFAGVVRTPSSSISGNAPVSIGGTRGGTDALRFGRSTGAVLFGPGTDVSFPNDPYLMPFLLPEEVANPVQGNVPDHITTDLLESARRISDPAERSLALRQIANGAIASNQLVLAHHTLEESITASSQVTVPLVRDQRLIGLVTSLTLLTDSLLRIGRENQTALAAEDEAAAAGLDPLPKRPESTVLIRLSRLEWRRAVYLADRIGNPTYRNEMLYRVAESEAMGSSTIAKDFGTTDMESLGNPSATAAGQPRAPGNPPPPPTPIPAPRSTTPPAPTRTPATPSSKAKEKAEFDKLADEVLGDAWEVASRIDWLIWKDRAMVRIALAAADSRQFRRGVALARTIRNAEARTEALILFGDAQSQYNDQKDQATITYQLAAEAVASITQAGLRGVMVGFLIDSLIASGRFDDARACTAMYPEESQRFVALGSVAESMGKRGRAPEARQWIATEAPEGYRSALYRRVAAGVLWSIEQVRSKELPIAR